MAKLADLFLPSAISLVKNIKIPRLMKITKAENDLLAKLLKQSKYCQNDKEPPFIITSKQEKIYDMTFAHLIEENYNARPIVPKTYFGQCRSK
jgi:hypothetical protein